MVVVYFDKSYICVYIYLESYFEGGLCIFCVDIEVFICGVIFLLKVLNYLIYQFEFDIVIIDYCVCGFICDINGMKYFIDYEINLIQNFMFDDMKVLYDMVDVNVYQENIFYIKMLFKEFDFKYYMFYIKLEDLIDSECQEIIVVLWKEMCEIYYGCNMLVV